MKIKNLHDLFVMELRDMYHAEKQILKALPKMAKAASDSELRSAFEEHLEQTRNQVSRLEGVFQTIEHKARGTTCEGMEGLITEGEEVMEAATDEDARDAALIASAQKVEHYEIASYGCMISWAEQLQMQKAAELLRQNLEEEKATDQKLTALAERRTNPQAQEPGAEQGQPEHWEGERHEQGAGQIEHHEVTV